MQRTRLIFASLLVAGMGAALRVDAQVGVDPAAATPRGGAAVLQAAAPDKSAEAQQAESVLRGAEVRRTDLVGKDQREVARPLPAEAPTSPKAEPGEFEGFVAAVVGKRLPRFGEWLVTDGARTFAPTPDAVVPPDYTLGPGDEIVVRTTGSIESDLRLVVDRAGQVYVPRVGRISVTGVRNDELGTYLAEQVGKRFRGFQLTVSVGQLRGIRVYVTGFARSPGSYTLGSLSTLVNAVMAAGGPAPGGSFRSIELRRANKVVTTFDFYDLLLAGDKSRDATLQSEDVIYVGPIGPQVAIHGSVNGPAIFEAKPGETLEDLLRFAGGLNSVADGTRFTVERLSNRGGDVVEQGPLDRAGATRLERGDIFRIFSAVDVALPVGRRAMVVRVEGEVNRPGDYYVAPGTRLAAVLAQAGGLTSRAYVFGSQFTREAVRRQQQSDYDKALHDFETDVSNAAVTTRSLGQEDAASREKQLELVQKLVERLRTVKPTGRLVLGLTPDSRDLPDLPLEDGDRLYLPPRPTTVQVFGAVFSAGSFAYRKGTTLGDFLTQAGGPKRAADKGSIFVVRADGTVHSNQQRWWSDIAGETAEPGDTIFVPDEMNRTTLLQGMKDFGTIFFQYSVGALAIKVLLGL